MRPAPEEHLAVIVRQALDSAWDPFMERVEGMTDDEYLWEPAADGWTVRQEGGEWLADVAEVDPDPAPVTSIAWRCWHLGVDALDGYSERLFAHTGTGMTGRSWVGDWASAHDLLRASWATFHDGVVSWEGRQLFAPLGPDWGPYQRHSHLDLVFHALREVVHHGAEIALLRDLYAAR